jgi:hypothetical protein
MIDDSPDTSKTEEGNGSVHYSSTILAAELRRPNAAQRT